MFFTKSSRWRKTEFARFFWRKKVIFVLFSTLVMYVACNDASFKPGNKKKNPAVATNQMSPVPTGTPLQPLPGYMPTPTNSPPLVPDGAVDGQEIFNDCERCVQRAIQLAAGVGFSTDQSKTKNLGFYKIDPAKNLCDIHFMQNVGDPIADHDGQDSVLGNQIVLYCPCDCGWGF